MRRFYSLILVLVVPCLFAGGGDHRIVASVMDEEAKARVAHEIQRLPLYFI